MIKYTLAGMALCLTVGCGTDKKADPAPVATTTPTTTAAVTWAQVKPLLINDCVSSNCHVTNSTGGAPTDYNTITEAAFKATNAKGRVTDNSMPQFGSTQAKAFTASDKTTILNFLNGK